MAETRAAESGATTKSSRIWKRTWFGALLTLCCAGILWAVDRAGNADPVLYAASFVAFVAVIEVSMMGTLLLRALPVILTVPMLGVALVEHACMEHPGEFAPWQQLGFEVIFAASVAACVHAVTRGLARQVLLRQVSVLLLAGAMVGVIGWLDTRGKSPLDEARAFGVFAALSALVALAVNMTAPRRRDLAIAIGLAVWIAVPLCALTQVTRHWGVRGLIALIVLSKVGDIAGYYVGNAIGRSRPFPTLSPNKTLAGCVGSLVAGLACGVAFAGLGLLPAAERSGPWVWIFGLAAGAVVNLAAQAGDLFESWVKRRARVKDSSTWLGPSGGVLDVVDSLLFSVPAALLTWPLLFPT